MIKLKTDINKAGDIVTGKFKARSRGADEFEKEMTSAVVALWGATENYLGEGKFLEIVARAKISLDNRGKETEE